VHFELQICTILILLQISSSQDGYIVSFVPGCGLRCVHCVPCK